MASQVTNYKCPACTGPLHFVGASGKLECDFCGGKYDVADIERLYAGKEAAAVEASEKAEAKAEANRQKMADMEAQGWDTSGLTSDWGAEADAAWRIGGGWGVNANYSWLRMEYPVPASPEHKLYAGGDFGKGRWSVSTGVQYIAGLYTAAAPDPEVREAGFVLWNLRASLRVNRLLTIFVRGENLLAERYEINAGYPMPRATVFGGLKLNL